MAQFFEFTANGIVFKGLQEIRQSIKSAWETTFGVELDDSPTSPDGHHIDLETKTVNSVLEAVQVVTTMLNRRDASGVFLDYLAALENITRNEGESDESLRSRMDSADTTGLATFDGMLTYLREQIHSSVNLLQNVEDVTDNDGIPPHRFRVVIPQAVYDALEDREEEEEGFDADNYISQKIWDCKPGGIKSDGNQQGEAIDKSGMKQEVKFSLPTDVGVEVSVTLHLYSEESFPTGGVQGVKDAIVGWATGTDGWAVAEFTPGKDVLPQRFLTPIMTVSGIASAELSFRKTGGSWSANPISISSQEIAVLTSVDVEVAQS